MGERLTFPNARKMSLGTPQNEIEAPALEHLLLPLRCMDRDLSEFQSNLTHFFGNLNHLFFNVKILELEIDGYYAALAPGDLIPFLNVKTLILRCTSMNQNPNHQFFRRVSNEASGGGSYLPQLNELVIKAKIKAHRFETLMETIRGFLVSREEQGSPIRILALPSIPHRLADNPVLKWFRQNQSFNLKLSTEYTCEFDSPLDAFEDS
jgi:hypothetical protein